MVGDVMSSQVVSCRADDDADKVMDLMARYQLRRIPVVDANNGILGIVAQADVAVRMEEPRKTAEVVERISQPNESNQVR
jgi:Mg/Co/Ni transporter MgtE